MSLHTKQINKCTDKGLAVGSQISCNHDVHNIMTLLTSNELLLVTHIKLIYPAIVFRPDCRQPLKNWIKNSLINTHGKSEKYT